MGLNTSRCRKHLQKGKAVFIPPERVAKIRHEEDVVRSQAKRENRQVLLHHSTCHCGSIDCVGIPVNISRKKRRA